MENWKTCELGDLLTFQRGHDLPKSQVVAGKYPIAGSNGIIGYHHEFTTKAPSITIGRSGNIGNPYFYENDFWAHNTTLYIREFKNSDPKFIYYLLKTLDFTGHNSGSAVPSLNRNFIHPIKVFVPESIEEQKAIAKILSSLDDKIELNRQMNSTLEAMTRVLFKAWFADFEPVRANRENRPSETTSPEIAKLFPSEFENGIPKGWRTGTLRDCCLKVESGGTPSRKVESYWANGKIAWLTSGEVRKPIVFDTKEYISVDGYYNSNAKLWKAGTTVVAMYGATAGEVCLLANEMTANQACCGLIPKEDYRAFLFTKTSQSKQELASKSSGSAQQNLNQSIVANFQILLPDENCIKAFEQVTGKLLDKWIENEIENQQLAEIRDSLLPRLVSGKIRVGEAENEIEVET